MRALRKPPTESSPAVRLLIAMLATGLLSAPHRLSAKEAASPTTIPAAAATSKGPCDTTLAKCPPRLHDEVWVVSSRLLGCPGEEVRAPQLETWHLDLKSHRWNASSLDAFLATDDVAVPTVIWVHGNWKDAGTAREEGLEVYQQLTVGAADHPIRFVIFSWPSTRTHGLREDARRKYCRTNSDSYYLAWLVCQIHRGIPVDFVGFSFGAKVVTGALHVLGGGPLAGHALPKSMVEDRGPYQAVPICAAVNNDALAIGGSNGQALPAVNRMLALNNGCDRALKHYPAVDPCSRPQALGYTGAVGPLGENASKLRQVDLCCPVGKEHYWGAYFYNPSIVARMRPYLGLAD
jgi:hypothetical protein